MASPVITLINEVKFPNGFEYLGASSSWSRATDEALGHKIKLVAQPIRNTTYSDFAFFDVSARRIIILNENLANVTFENPQVTQVRARINAIIDRVYMQYGPNVPNPEVQTIRAAASFEVMAYRLVNLLNQSDGLDPHQRGWWHNFCHSAGIRH